MKILIIHNAYGRRSGEEAVVETTVQLLRDHGHQVVTFFRSSAVIPEMAFGRVRAFLSGINSPSARRELAALLEAETPDVVNVHNVYPLISPEVLPECTKRGIPVVMTVHNYRLLCPNGLFFSHGEVCERCLDTSEWACVTRNCEGSHAKSIGYALRNAVARHRRTFTEHVSHFAVLTNFQKGKLIQGGFPGVHMTVVGNPVEPIAAAEGAGDYGVYVGRLSREKGVDVLFEAARRCADVPIKVAGSIRHGEDFGEPPANVELLGFVSGPDLDKLMREARFLVLPSRCYEGFPISLAQAMSCGRPVIAPRHGGIPEIVADEETGLLFEPGSAEDLGRCMTTLWTDAEKARTFGAAAAESATAYVPEQYYEKLMGVFEGCVAGKGRGAGGSGQ